MAETFTALLCAHVLADFLFQSNWMVANKGRIAGLAAHGAVVLALTLAVTGSFALPLWLLALAHLGVDWGKAHAPQRGLLPFLVDQALHLGLIAALAGLSPGLWASGLWAQILPLPPLLALLAGLVLATRAGGFAIGMLMQPWAEASPEGLPGGGRVIGLLERGLIFLLVISGQSAGIGFLIAAKSVLRFGSVGDDRKISEYVIIGTLASFGWAMAVAFGTVALMSALWPLGIPDLTP